MSTLSAILLLPNFGPTLGTIVARYAVWHAGCLERESPKTTQFPKWKGAVKNYYDKNDNDQENAPECTIFIENFSLFFRRRTLHNHPHWGGDTLAARLSPPITLPINTTQHGRSARLLGGRKLGCSRQCRWTSTDAQNRRNRAAAPLGTVTLWTDLERKLATKIAAMMKKLKKRPVSGAVVRNSLPAAFRLRRLASRLLQTIA